MAPIHGMYVWSCHIISYRLLFSTFVSEVFGWKTFGVAEAQNTRNKESNSSPFNSFLVLEVRQGFSPIYKTYTKFRGPGPPGESGEPGPPMGNKEGEKIKKEKEALHGQRLPVCSYRSWYASSNWQKADMGLEPRSKKPTNIGINPLFDRVQSWSLHSEYKGKDRERTISIGKHAY